MELAPKARHQTLHNPITPPRELEWEWHTHHRCLMPYPEKLKRSFLAPNERAYCVFACVILAKSQPQAHTPSRRQMPLSRKDNEERVKRKEIAS